MFFFSPLLASLVTLPRTEKALESKIQFLKRRLGSPYANFWKGEPVSSLSLHLTGLV